jgi:hypothetical protein
MALVDGNDLTFGLRGKFGKLFVFRRLRSKTFASRRSDAEIKWSPAQQAQRERFRQATLFAKRAMLDPEMKERYQIMARETQNASAFAAAITDYLKRGKRDAKQ